MRLSISNIAWTSENDCEMYDYIKNIGFEGIEIAPTRIFQNEPYNNLEMAKKYAIQLKQNYGLAISSMQSIWYGRTEKIFGSNEERKVLANYTRKAIDFASSMNCKNVVFGCPKNRISENANDMEIAISFFKELGEYAKEKKTVISMEPNPVIYNTNFINYTSEAFQISRIVNSDSFKVNIDLGTVIYNNEAISMISDNIDLVNHVHISEPNLALIEKRKLHVELANILRQVKYDKFVSIEMGKRENLDEIKQTIKYIKEVFS
ncbi:sugar phosphate isomerase/epimerase family protein [Clostridium sp. C2-6-12]|uniref:sugar phosphate isomerase/epimerase family protein n=1 Tax=Clostridium sp. C2-6-12 TaxID=2698832 RepID=UPI001367C522|nr:sugar phosphate isomerase/epimerase family protein [Clostridium sp. C2-6-12]